MDQPMGNACVRQEPQEAPSPTYTPSGLDVCREVTIGRQKTNKFKLASEHVGHASMGAASVLDGVPVHEDSGGVCLLIIDPQGDFHEGGSLAVAGATADSERIAALLLRHAEQIDRVVVTLDTHHTMHIAHAAFWKDAAGASPAPHTAITHADVKAGKWLPRQQELAGWALKYTESLEEGGRFTHYIWPTHCLLGSAGHAVSPALMPALNTWSQQRERSIT